MSDIGLVLNIFIFGCVMLMLLFNWFYRRTVIKKSRKFKMPLHDKISLMLSLNLLLAAISGLFMIIGLVAKILSVAT